MKNYLALVLTTLIMFLAESCTKSKFFGSSPTSNGNLVLGNNGEATKTPTPNSSGPSTGATTGDEILTLAISANPTQLVADNSSTSTVTVKVTDQKSKPLSGMKLEVSSDRPVADHIVLTGTDTTDPDGTLVFKVSSTIPGTSNLTAKISANPVVLTKIAIKFSPIPQPTLNVVTSPSIINKTADGSQTPVLVIIKDANGAPVANKSISFSPGFWNINPATLLTDANGAANFLISSMTPGNGAMSTLVNGTMYGNQVNISYTQGTPNCDENNPEATRAEFVSSVFDPPGLNFGLKFTVVFRVYKISCAAPYGRISLNRSVDSILFDFNTFGGSITNDAYSIISDTSANTLLQSGKVVLVQNSDLFGNTSPNYRHWSTDKPLTVDSGNNAILIKFSYSVPSRDFYDVAGFPKGSLVTTLRYGSAAAVKVQIPDLPKEY